MLPDPPSRTSAAPPRSAATTDEAAQAAQLRALLPQAEDPQSTVGIEDLAMAVLRWARARTAARAVPGRSS